MFGNKFLLLELDPFEAEYYHLPQFVPYLQKEQKHLKKEGFSWDKAVDAMSALVKEEDCEEYKLYKYIGMPAMWATLLSGIMLIMANSALFTNGWFHAKLLLVILLVIYSQSLEVF